MSDNEAAQPRPAPEAQAPSSDQQQAQPAEEEEAAAAAAKDAPAASGEDGLMADGAAQGEGQGQQAEAGEGPAVGGTGAPTEEGHAPGDIVLESVAGAGEAMVGSGDAVTSDDSDDWTEGDNHEMKRVKVCPSLLYAGPTAAAHRATGLRARGRTLGRPGHCVLLGSF
jgi:hypothetical protein